jgi:hypothetical protein
LLSPISIGEFGDNMTDDSEASDDGDEEEEEEEDESESLASLELWNENTSSLSWPIGIFAGGGKDNFGGFTPIGIFAGCNFGHMTLVEEDKED